MHCCVIKVGRITRKPLKLVILSNQHVVRFMKIKRRFIAGVRCPKCEALDKVIMLTTDDDEWIECIECGYSDRRPTQVEPSEDTALPDDMGVIQFKPRQPK